MKEADKGCEKGTPQKTRITFFDLFGGGQKVISGFLFSSFLVGSMLKIHLCEYNVNQTGKYLKNDFLWSKKWGVQYSAYGEKIRFLNN